MTNDVPALDDSHANDTSYTRLPPVPLINAIAAYLNAGEPARISLCRQAHCGMLRTSLKLIFTVIVCRSGVVHSAGQQRTFHSLTPSPTTVPLPITPSALAILFLTLVGYILCERSIILKSMSANLTYHDMQYHPERIITLHPSPVMEA
ncbi:hypothetical protein D9756_006911 [Leucocoprinus leucothites]|uniref:Uncharacterized protein n=1 Tax=Leucocoprinus leucothites TaxID=201217 RepID=A0A8H5D5K9_9AGAR|nr:hypothetical protein D9756_006911 [Leucoagaricus leucothites]